MHIPTVTLIISLVVGYTLAAAPMERRQADISCNNGEGTCFGPDGVCAENRPPNEFFIFGSVDEFPECQPLVDEEALAEINGF